MHCECCDRLLTEAEQQIIFVVSGVEANTCLKCLETMDVDFKMPRSKYDDYEAQATTFLEEHTPLYDEDELWDER